MFQTIRLKRYGKACQFEIVTDVPQGQFTGRTTVDMLTLYRIGCMAETSATTRREERDYLPLETASPSLPSSSSSASPLDSLAKRTDLGESTEARLLEFADRLSSGIDPTNENITVQEFKFLEEINTAMFALNICNSGLPLHQMCQYLDDPSIGMHLEDNYIIQSQAVAIVCYAAANGLFFDESNDQLLSDLAKLEWAVQMHAYGAQSVADLCQNLDYRAASMLGISVDEIHQIVCNGTGGIGISSATAPLTTAPASTGSSMSNPTSISGTGAAGASMTGRPLPGTASTGMPFVTGTNPQPTSSSIVGTGNSMNSTTSGK